MQVFISVVTKEKIKFDENKLLEEIAKNVYFEYDNEINEYCVFFKNIEGYYWQWKTKELALLELISWYLEKYE